MFKRRVIPAVCFFLCSCFVAFAQNDTGRTVLGTHQDDVESVAFAPNDMFVATGSWDKTVQVFSGDSSFTYLQTLKGHKAAVSAIGFSGHGQMLVTAGRDYRIMVWSKKGKKNFELVKQLPMVHTAGINTIAVGPYGNMIYSAGYDGRIVVYNMRRESHRIIENKLPIYGISLSLNRQFIYCADASSVVKMYDGIGNKIRELKGHQDVVNAVDCNNQYILTGSSDQTAILWNVVNGKKVRTFQGHQWKVTSVQISADGKYAITGSIDGQTKIWDIETGEEVNSFKEDNGTVRQVAMSRSMHYVVSAMHMDTSVVYDSYGASIWRSGLSFDPSVMQAQYAALQRKTRNNNSSSRNTTGNSGLSRNNTSNKSASKQTATNAKVIEASDEIIITIEDE